MGHVPGSSEPVVSELAGREKERFGANFYKAMWLDEVVEVDERAGKTGGDLDAEFVLLASNPTEDESMSDSTVDLSGKSRTRCAKS
jgi:hypothetical protein